MNLEAALAALVADPTYGIPLVIITALAIWVGWWSRMRTSALPPMTPGTAPEIWKLQLGALAHYHLREGRYLAAIDGLNRRLAVVVRDRFHVRISEPSELDSSAVNAALPRPLTLKGLVRDLRRAYNHAAWTETTGGLAARWPWLHRRQQRRSAREFAALSRRVSAALSALEPE